MDTPPTLALAITGAGGAGAMRAGEILLAAAGRAGLFGRMTRAMGPQIRGGEAAALLRLAPVAIESPPDSIDLLIALDWDNFARFADEIPLTPASLVLTDPDQGPVPPSVAASAARVAALPAKALARAIPGGRANMVALGAAARLLGLPQGLVAETIARHLGAKGAEAMAANHAALGRGFAAELPGLGLRLTPAPTAVPRWQLSGNQATGYGALAAGVRFVAAYPITPATEVLEYLAPALEETGGVLVQAEDELAAVNMTIGAGFAGIPALTATSGPGLSLMVEALGLAVASETPLVVVDVMRGGPSTGIPTKSEQSDLNIALYGLHGDAPHLVLAPNGIGDCARTTAWAVGLAETLQVPALVLSDQALGQSRAVIAPPPPAAPTPGRLLAAAPAAFRRYEVTPSGLSPMTLPGTEGGAYVADGLEHSPRGAPSATAADHAAQLAKRARKLECFDFGPDWADAEGTGPTAILTWGSPTAAAQEAARRSRAEGRELRVISLRLLAPAQPARLAALLAGVTRVLVVEQSEGAQFHRYLRAFYDLPPAVSVLARPGPLPIRPGEILARLRGQEEAP
ncbi:MAG: 2-oxoacid:acceptor oxidoreductase subunit alpha [Acetobacteraceae bacterium]